MPRKKNDDDPKPQCTSGCLKWGRWVSGKCTTCRRYLKRTGGRTLGWRVARYHQVNRWGSHLAGSIPQEELLPQDRLPARRPPNVIDFAERASARPARGRTTATARRRTR